MSNKPRNKWIALGLRFFLYFLLILGTAFVFAALPTAQLGMWGELGKQIVKYVFIGLPIASFAACAYGLFRIDRTNESGDFEAIGVMLLLGAYGAFWLYSAL